MNADSAVFWADPPGSCCSKKRGNPRNEVAACTGDVDNRNTIADLYCQLQIDAAMELSELCKCGERKETKALQIDVAMELSELCKCHERRDVR